MNSEIFNPYEGKEVGRLVWPFYRYSALIPEQIGGDLFVWLYLSLITYFNQNNGRAIDSYSDEVKLELQKIICDKFSSVIDAQTFDKIVVNVEKDFIVEVIDTKGKKSKKLRGNTFSFIDTYENLFSDKLEIQYIYQDAVTGEVLPFFGNTEGIVDIFNAENRISIREGIKEPSKRAVKKAYEQYVKIRKLNDTIEEKDIELFEEYVDEDEQTFFDTDEEAEPFAGEKQGPQNLDNYNVIYLKNKRAVYNLEVPLIIEDNRLIAKSPFDDITNQWMNKCLKKGRNISDEVDSQIKDYEALYVLEERKIGEYIEEHKNDFASQLKVFSTLYRMIDTLNDNKLREYVVKLDARFSEQSELFYFYCGKFLERMVKSVKYNKSDSAVREMTDFDGFCRELDIKLQHKALIYDKLKSKNIYDDWVKKFARRDGKEHDSFKADVADVLLRSSLCDSQLMYPSFVEDIFNLYSRRSMVDHDNDKEIELIESATAESLVKVTKVLFELI